VDRYSSKLQITVVTFLNNWVSQANVLVRAWHTPRAMSAPEHMAQGCFLCFKSTGTLHDKVDKFFQDSVPSTHGTLIELEVHTRRDFLRRSSASLDHIITWNLTCKNTCTMQSSTSKVHLVGAECNDPALISCTVCGDLLTY